MFETLMAMTFAIVCVLIGFALGRYEDKKPDPPTYIELPKTRRTCFCGYPDDPSKIHTMMGCYNHPLVYDTEQQKTTPCQCKGALDNLEVPDDKFVMHYPESSGLPCLIMNKI